MINKKICEEINKSFDLAHAKSMARFYEDLSNQLRKELKDLKDLNKDLNEGNKLMSSRCAQCDVYESFFNERYVSEPYDDHFIVINGVMYRLEEYCIEHNIDGPVTLKANFISAVDESLKKKVIGFKDNKGEGNAS